MSTKADNPSDPASSTVSSGQFAHLFDEAVEFQGSSRDLELREEDALEAASALDQIDLVAARYDIHEEFAAGGMKRIMRATDLCTDRVVAMAVIKRLADSSAVDRFVREARITAILEHPNIVPVYDIGLDADRRPFFTMKLVTGRTLQDIIDDLREEKVQVPNRRSLADLLDILIKICDAVAYAHANRIVHLDIKPSNIQVSDYGEVLLFDWGLSRYLNKDGVVDTISSDIHTPDDDLVDEDIRKLTSTLDGRVRGTPGYMASEQATGLNSTRDHRTDIYALGAVLYTILTQQRPYSGSTVEQTLEQTITGQLDRPSERVGSAVPPGLEAVCMKAMTLDPEERYQTVSEMKTDILAFTQGFATSAEEAGFADQLRLFIRRNQRICGVLAAVAIVLVMVVSGFMAELKQSERQARAAEREAQTLLGRAKKAEQVRLRAEQERRAAVAMQNQLTEDALPNMLDRIDRALNDHKVAQAAATIETVLAIDPTNFDARIHQIYVQIAMFEFNQVLKEMRKLTIEDKADGTTVVSDADILKLFPEMTVVRQFTDQVVDGQLPFDVLLNFLRRLKPLEDPHLTHLILSSPKLDDLTADHRQKLAELAFSLLNRKTKLSFSDLKSGGLRIGFSGKWVDDIFPLYKLPVTELDLRNTVGLDSIDIITTLPLKRIYLSKPKDDHLETIDECDTIEQLYVPHRYRRTVTKKVSSRIKVVGY